MSKNEKKSVVWSGWDYVRVAVWLLILVFFVTGGAFLPSIDAAVKEMLSNVGLSAIPSFVFLAIIGLLMIYVALSSSGSGGGSSKKKDLPSTDIGRTYSSSSSKTSSSSGSEGSAPDAIGGSGDGE